MALCFAGATKMSLTYEVQLLNEYHILFNKIEARVIAKTLSMNGNTRFGN